MKNVTHVVTDLDRNSTRFDTRAYECALDQLGVGVWCCDMAKREVKTDHRYQRIVADERSRTRFLSWEQRIEIVHSDDRERYLTEVERVVKGEAERYTVEIRITRFDGVRAWIEEVGWLGERRENGRPRQLCGTIRDITEFHRERSFLRQRMQELNHRVKNNLAIVASLINLKGMALGDGVDLSDIESHVAAIAMLHERLTEMGESDFLRLDRYVHSFLSRTFEIYRAEGVHRRVRVAPLKLSSKVGVSVGLVVNELVTNALKHGRVAEREMNLTVVIERDKKARCVRVVVEDDGNRWPDGLQVERATSFGLQLVVELVRQYDGTVRRVAGEETRIEVRYPIGSVCSRLE